MEGRQPGKVLLASGDFGIPMARAGQGRLVIVSGPSGAGKTTLMREVLRCSAVPLWPSVSATTRPPRPGEKDGVDYYFLSPEEFEARRRRGEFLECFQVHQQGHWYGTPAREVLAGLAQGKWVVLEIDVQGAMAVREQFPEAISIFIRPGSDEYLEELQRRLRGRGEPEASIAERLQTARRELALADRYQYQVVNDRIPRAVEEICDILTRHWETDRNDR